jgi:uncharacterized protein (TIGR00290 family)
MICDNLGRYNMKKNIWVSWSTGKDCAYALYQLSLSNDYEITGLLTSLNAAPRSVPMHRSPEYLLKRQALELGLPLFCVEVQNHEQQMRDLLKKAANQNVSHIAFGDLFLEELRLAREEKMKESGITPIFPLWKMPTPELSRKMVSAGFKAVIASVDLRALPKSFLGRVFDEQFLNDLPPHVDPCGENGEFHTFVFDGPIFRRPIPVNLGEITIEGDHGFIGLLSPSSRH